MSSESDPQSLYPFPHGKRQDAGQLVPSSSIHRIQECHVTAYRILWDLVHTLLADDRGSAASKRAAA